MQVRRGLQIEKSRWVAFRIAGRSSVPTWSQGIYTISRLFEYSSNTAIVHIRVIADGYMYWNIYYSWGNRKEQENIEGYGNKKFSVENLYGRRNDRLLVRFQAAAGVYSLEMSDDKKESPPKVSITVFLIGAFGTFICGFCFVFFTTFFCMTYVINQPPSTFRMSISQSDTVLELATEKDLEQATKVSAFESSKVLSYRNASCVICLEEFLSGEKVRLLQCDHIFHKDCIDMWLMTAKNKCPICHQKITDAQCLFRSQSQSTIRVSMRCPKALSRSRTMSLLSKTCSATPDANPDFLAKNSNSKASPATAPYLMKIYSHTRADAYDESSTNTSASIRNDETGSVSWTLDTPEYGSGKMGFIFAEGDSSVSAISIPRASTSNIKLIKVHYPDQSSMPKQGPQLQNYQRRQTADMSKIISVSSLKDFEMFE